MASWYYRLTLNTAQRLCFNQTAKTTNVVTTSSLGIPKAMLLSIKINTFSSNTLKNSITNLKPIAAAAATLDSHTSTAQFCGSSTFHASTPLWVNSSATPLLLTSKYKSLQQNRNFSSLSMPLQFRCSRLVHQNAMAPLKYRRFISSKEITKNMTLYTNGTLKSEVDRKTLELKKPTGNPLVLMMAWLMAKQKHIKKYAEIYTNLGFDVIVVNVTPWQFLWPVKGTQMVAADTLKFLDNNKSYSPIVLHGFSVAAYQFGELMLQMSRDMERYSHILNRIVCQVWDSTADVSEIADGLPKCVFPKNPHMQTVLRHYAIYHMKTFHNQATIHYLRSSHMFHFTLCKKPALFFVSENDPIGPPSSNQLVREDWERAGIKVTFKCWKHSQHAAHFLRHRDEYLDTLFKHLEDCGVLEAAVIKQEASS